MDAVLAEQLPDTWDSFPLFQILNDYLRMDGIAFHFLLVFVCISTFQLVVKLRATGLEDTPRAVYRRITQLFWVIFISLFKFTHQ